MHIREAHRITITQLHGGAAVQFFCDPHLNKSLKARFPKARWGAATKSWHIPGKLAGERAALWAAEQDDYLKSIEARARDAEWDAPAQPPKPRKITWRAIPGQPPRDATTAPPKGDIDRIVSEINAHNDLATFCGVLGRPSAGIYRLYPADWAGRWGDKKHPWVETYQPSLAGRRMEVEWEWAALYGGVGWSKDGWLPSVDFPVFWPIFNPGVKRPWTL